MNCMMRLIAEENGQDVVEYALLVALVALVTLAGWDAIVRAVGRTYGWADGGLWNLYWREPGT